jgi:hypothetical protein
VTFRRREFILPAILVALPVSLGVFPEIVGERLAIYLPGIVLGGVALGLALVLAAQMTMTVIRLPARTEALVRRRALLGRAFVVALASAFIAYETHEVAHPTARFGGFRTLFADSPLLGSSAVMALAVAVFALACMVSWRGPLSGLLCLVAGSLLASTFRRLRVEWGVESLLSALGLVLFLGALAIMLVVVLVRAWRGQEALRWETVRASFREKDLGYAPLALALLVDLVSQLALLTDRLRHDGSVAVPQDLLSFLYVAILALGIARARRQDDLECLRWAGLGALFREHELALVPWALANLAEQLSRIRLSAAGTGDDPLLSATTASTLYPHVPVVAFYATGLAVLVGLPFYLRFVAVTPDTDAPGATAP